MKSSSRIIGATIAFGYFLFCIAFVKAKLESWNDIARVASIESLVERGTWAIDESAWADQTADKIFLGGKFYSDKLPILSVSGAGVYALLHFVFGTSLAPNCTMCAYAPLTLILVSLPTAMMLWLFFDFAARQNIPMWASALGAIALGSATMILPYSLVLNHHVPAAYALFASFYLLTRLDSSVDSAIRSHTQRAQITFAGFLAALAISFDIPSGIIAASLFAIAFARFRRAAIFFAIGGGIPIAITALLDYQIAGTIIPAYLIPEGYAYPGSEFPALIGGNARTPDDYAAYAFRMFLGGKGLFAYNALLVFALIGALSIAVARKHRLHIQAAWVALGFIALSFYLAIGTGNFGGNAYGERWFIPAIPVLFVFIFFARPLMEIGNDLPGHTIHRLITTTVWLLFISAFALWIFSSL